MLRQRAQRASRNSHVVDAVGACQPAILEVVVDIFRGPCLISIDCCFHQKIRSLDGWRTLSTLSKHSSLRLWRWRYRWQRCGPCWPSSRRGKYFNLPENRLWDCFDSVHNVRVMPDVVHAVKACPPPVLTTVQVLFMAGAFSSFDYTASTKITSTACHGS